MSYNRGRAYSLAISCRELRNYKRPLAIQMVEMFNFIRYSIHGEMSAIGSSSFGLICSLALIYGYSSFFLPRMHEGLFSAKGNLFAQDF